MAPQVVEAVASSAAKDFKKESTAARLLGSGQYLYAKVRLASPLTVSGSAGIAELAVFHPVDTIAKRLMSNEGKMTVSKLNEVIFKDKAHAPLSKKFTSLFPGLGYAAGYKVSPPFVSDCFGGI